MAQLTISTVNRSYPVVIETGLLSRTAELVRGLAQHRRTLLVVDENIASNHGKVVREALQASGIEVLAYSLTATEARKSFETAKVLYDAMVGARVDRSCPVIALGGGIIGDVAGFAAATFLRGVPLIIIPTTLLAMVDASIGGKTAINLALPGGGLGKNLVGAFWQPCGVLIDPMVLQTLSTRELRCGLAECIKHAMIADESLLDFLQQNMSAILTLQMEPLCQLIERSVMIKANIVQQDEREAGVRILLNLGHTFAHAFESIEDLGLRHGEAVAIGLIAAMTCSVQTNRLTAPEVERVRSLLAAAGLPTRLPAPVESSRIRAAMEYDKKVRDGTLRLVLPRGLGRAEVADDVPAKIVELALLEVGASRGGS